MQSSTDTQIRTTAFIATCGCQNLYGLRLHEHTHDICVLCAAGIAPHVSTSCLCCTPPPQLRQPDALRGAQRKPYTLSCAAAAAAGPGQPHRRQLGLRLDMRAQQRRQSATRRQLKGPRVQRLDCSGPQPRLHPQMGLWVPASKSKEIFWLVSGWRPCSSYMEVIHGALMTPKKTSRRHSTL